MIDAYRASDSKQEMIDLAYKMEQLHHDYASFVPGVYQPFYRVGYWRWVRYPKSFNEKYSGSAGQYFVQWIDPKIKEETLAARKKGKTFPASIKTYDQFK
jgi:microcin C transport system substrate-binding protein